MRALVADDDRLASTILARALAQWGLAVAIASDGDEAWARLQEDPGLGLAVLDWMMPGLDGPALCTRIRQDPAHAHMHVILLTSRDDRGDIVKGLDAGADDYLIKPFDPEEFRARVRVGIRVITLQDHLAARVRELEDALTNVKQLRGLLPICSYCKRVRADGDYWEQVEHYIAHHSDAKFSHGICPACFDAAVANLPTDVTGGRVR
jgi:sigma-B regulation protein RsbU (phosphoserine phosphatase)